MEEVDDDGAEDMRGLGESDGTSIAGGIVSGIFIGRSTMRDFSLCISNSFIF